jgi:DNA-binding NarL/FixJ family response regulator
MTDMTVATLRAELDAERAENVRLRVALTTARALEAMLLVEPTPSLLVDSPELSAKLATRSSRILTPRERQVLTRIHAGDSNRQIAKRLFIAVSTVKIHLMKLSEKFGTHNRTGTLVAAMDAGFVPDQKD